MIDERRKNHRDAGGGAEAAGHGAHSLPGGVDAIRAHRAARTGCTVLITGETGVGKGWLARWIHDHSPRSSGPFVPVNCGAIPDSIIDSHLFGHARGSFSGATREHPGMIRSASGGTLLLDEVSELPFSAQVRLLRLLQDRDVQPVGFARPVLVDVRVIAATNVDLNVSVSNGRFREDLLYRLDVVRLHVKPLRERLEDLATLIHEFNAEFAALHNRNPLEFTLEALQALHRYLWPGNIRQVRTVVERLHVLCPNDLIAAEDLVHCGGLRGLENVASLPSIEQVRLDHVRHVLQQSDGSISRAAESLGIHRSTLYRWLRDQRD